ncbi:toxin-antitoxin system HicB family antitoxin [Sulfitobacter sp. M39]|nr:toxin-antitoxin system HicB family antitoxin [Sulfitobacter sp. M39]
MKTMNYKGYLGSIEVDTKENILYGKLLHIRDLVNYESESAAGLEVEFQTAVDEYLEDSKNNGIEADKPFKGSFNVRVSPELHRELAASAKKADTTLNDYIVNVLSCHRERTIADKVASIGEDQWLQFTSFNNAKIVDLKVFEKVFRGISSCQYSSASVRNVVNASETSKPGQVRSKSFVARSPSKAMGRLQ